MLRRAKDFKHFKLRARDGDIGSAVEFYFDDQHWTVRYLVADTGGWLTGRQVLISPFSLDPVDSIDHALPVRLTKQQIEDSPSLSTHLPVSRQFELQFNGYYGWPMYWYGPYMWGPVAYPTPRPEGWGVSTTGNTLSTELPVDAVGQAVKKGDPHLRSTLSVTGHHIQATDGEIGHVEDFIIDDETWAIRYLIVDTKNWLPGTHVLISPRWIKRVSWGESKVFVKLTRDAVEASPRYSPESLNRDYETLLHQHYREEGYWADELAEQSV